MKHSEQINELALAMSKMQSEIIDASKDSAGYGYRYADLPQVLSVIRPILGKHGLSIMQPVTNHEDKVMVTTIVMHSSGQWMASDLIMPIADNKGMSVQQRMGTSITYARRYSIISMVGIAQTDDQPATEPAYIAESKESAYIDVNQVLELSAMIFEADITQVKFCEYCDIANLQMLPKDGFEKAKKKLQKTIDEKKNKPTPADYASV